MTAPEHGAELFKAGLSMAVAGELLYAALQADSRMAPHEIKAALQQWRRAADAFVASAQKPAHAHTLAEVSQ